VFSIISNEKISEFRIPAEAGNNILFHTINLIYIAEPVPIKVVNLLRFECQNERAIDHCAFLLILQSGIDQIPK
jgi:hypothetical protein